MTSTKQLALVLAVLVSLHLLVWCGAAVPKVTNQPAVMTWNDFQKGARGASGPSECDSQYHSNSEMLVALSTGWYAHGQRCFKLISITSQKTGRTVQAKVVDECDSTKGCKTNIVDTSTAVWNALGLDINVGVEKVTWSDV